VCISTRELRQLQADVRHLHDENLALAMVIRHGWHERRHPLKAPIEAVKKLSMDTITMYFASLGKSARYRQDGLPYKYGFLKELERQNLVVISDKAFLFIATPDEMLITLEFKDQLVQLDDVKKKYVEFLYELHRQDVPAERVRLYRKPRWTSLETAHPRGRALNVSRMPRPSLVAVHLEQFQIFVDTFGTLNTKKTITLDVSSCDSIRQLRWKIHDKEGIPLDQFYLNFNGRMLKDHLIVATYNIQKESTIRVQFRLRGGAKKGVKKTTKQQRVVMIRGITTTININIPSNVNTASKFVPIPEADCRMP